MEHKVGDRVRIKQLEGFVRFSGELGVIDELRRYSEIYIVQLTGKENNETNKIGLSKDEFINLEHSTNNEDTPITAFGDSSYIKPEPLPSSSKQINFNFDLPIETQTSDLQFEIDGKEYSVMITRIG